MNLSFYIYALCVLVFAVLTMGQDKKTCQTAFTEMSKRHTTWINSCVKQLGYKTAREKTKKVACVWKCVMDNLQLLNDSGFMDQTQYNKHLNEEWPENMKYRANITFQPCLKIGGPASDVGTDEFCKDYDPLMKCLNRNFASLCKGL